MAWRIQDGALRHSPKFAARRALVSPATCQHGHRLAGGGALEGETGSRCHPFRAVAVVRLGDDGERLGRCRFSNFNERGCQESAGKRGIIVTGQLAADDQRAFRVFRQCGEALNVKGGGP